MQKASEIKKFTFASYLDHGIDLQEKIECARAELKRGYPFIHRLSLAIYHPERDMLQTFVYDEDGATQLHNYEALLAQCKSLQELALTPMLRVVNDIAVFDKNQHKHSDLIRQAGYQSSVTMPLILEEQLLGFLFADSKQRNVFTGEVLQEIRLTAMVFTLLLQQNIEKIKVLKSALKSMQLVSFYRDSETAEHQQRMASYSQLIARELAASHHLSDLDINDIYLYAPLHDVGKLLIADDILLKEGPLSEDEFLIMQGHTAKGDALVEKLINLYQLSEFSSISVLRSIIRSHHEKMDGSGYPDALTGEQIPLAVRIVTVADIFDALTSVRPYKEAWTMEAAFSELTMLAGSKLDADCVHALMNNKRDILSILKKFKERK